MKKLIIFDLDGTLLDTIADLAAATNQALETYGFPTHPTEAYRFQQTVRTGPARKGTQ